MRRPLVLPGVFQMLPGELLEHDEKRAGFLVARFRSFDQGDPQLSGIFKLTGVGHAP